MNIKPASFGSVSHGTLRTVDLINAFANELEWQIRRNGEYFAKPEHFAFRNKLNNLVDSAYECLDESGEALDTAKEESGEADEMVNDLQDALSVNFAPMYADFGAHPGDGSDFGYWVDVDNVREQVEFVSSKDSEYPEDDFRGEWLHISDHGNATLYVRENCADSRAPEQFTDREIWSVV